MGLVGVVNGTLKEVLIDTSNEMVSLDLASQVMAVQGESATVLAELLNRLQRLQHRSPFVQQLLFHRHRLPRGHRLPSLLRQPVYLSASVRH